MTSDTVATGPTRVRFRERQVLRGADLDAEQAYLDAARRRHNIGHHGWGIVHGLQLVDRPEAAVLPGMAVDGYGRELIVPSPLIIPDAAFTELNTGSIDVWLFYDAAEMTVSQRGVWQCGPGRGARVRERAMLRLTVAPADDPNHPRETPRNPIEVPSADLPFPPYRTGPRDAAKEWPVYLGTVKKTAALTFEPNSPRPYATLTGESVTSPSGRARMQVGSELESDSRRFAVSVSDSAGKLVERIAVDRDGNTIVNANTTLGTRLNKPAIGNGAEATTKKLRMRENKPPAGVAKPTTEPLCLQSSGNPSQETPGAARMINFTPLAAEPLVPQPWRIYRTSIKRGKRTIRQLRLEIGHPGDKGDPRFFKLAIRSRDNIGDFKECLSVAADCTVTINGDVTVQAPDRKRVNYEVGGQVIKGEIQADPTDPLFISAIATEWATGTVIGKAQHEALFTGINAGELSLDITDLRARRPSATTPRPVVGSFEFDEILTYNYRVRNTGLNQITGIQLYVRVTFDDLTKEETLPATAFDLTPGSQRSFPGTFNPGGQPGVLEISVVGLGINPVPIVTAAADSVVVTVTAPPAATIQGLVRDINGASLPGTIVRLKSLETNVIQLFTTDAEGRFTAPNLLPGRYTVTVDASGFNNPQTVDLDPGETVNLILSPEAIP